jgi:hypothetical protein
MHTLCYDLDCRAITVYEMSCLHYPLELLVFGVVRF